MAGPVDLVLFNGKVVTVDRDFAIRQAVAIAGGRIVFVGEDAELASHGIRARRSVDLGGRTVMPGIVDSHMHMMSIGLEQQRLSLASAATIADVLDAIDGECRRLGPGAWVVTSQVGFSPGQLVEKRLPNRWQLDRVSPANPVILTRGSHFAVVNSEGLRLAGIDRHSVTPPGGVIMKDPTTGEPNGWLGDMALQQVRRLLPAVTHDERIDALRAAMRELNGLGVTAIIEPSPDRDDPGFRAYGELWSREELTVRTRLMVGTVFQAPPLADIERGPEAVCRERGLGKPDDPMLGIWGVKLAVDGGVETGFLREPYGVIPGEQDDPAYRGVLTMSEDEVHHACALAARHGWRVGIHTVGDAAMDMVLGVFERVDAAWSIAGRRWCVIHGFLPQPEHFPVMRRLGVTVACQHSHNYTKGDSLVKWWGLPRASRANPVKEYLRQGVAVGGGSDGKSCEWRTSVLMWADLTRQTRLGGVLGPELALTREEMLRSHTIDAAFVLGEDREMGSIETGKRADLVVLSRDVMTCAVGDILDLRAVMTMVDGKIVHRDDGAPAISGEDIDPVEIEA